MKENVGTIDRIARTVVGPVLIYLGYEKWGGKRGELKGLLNIVGGALIVESAITRVCPVNGLLGLDTRGEKVRSRDREQQKKQQSRAGSYGVYY